VEQQKGEVFANALHTLKNQKKEESSPTLPGNGDRELDISSLQNLFIR
jgi:hypothetical protein